MSNLQPSNTAADGAIGPLALKRGRYHLLTPAVSRAADRIVVEHCKAPDRGRRCYSELIPEGRCQITIALRRGRARVHRNGRLMHEGPIYPGMVRVAQPGDLIEGEVFSAVEAVNIDLPVSRLADWWTPMVAHVRPILTPDVRTEQLGRMLVEASQAEVRHRALFGQGVVDALMAIVLDHDRREQADHGARTTLAGEEMRRVLDFADAKIGQKLGLSDWASAIGLPAREFARRFRLTTGSSPYAFFLRRRIERAKELLTDTDARLVEIALDVGFGSQSHFTETFRRFAGTSPGAWRRRR